jgi:hypothetical protein
MVAQFRSVAYVMACTCLFSKPCAADEALPRTEIVKRGKAATALVDFNHRYGSAFCVHPSGLFVTYDPWMGQVVNQGTITLVLHAGLKTQQKLTAQVVRRDPALNLMLLRTAGEHKLPALTLGSDQELTELMDLVAFGFPFGRVLGTEGTYPTITVSAGRINSLRRDKNGDLFRIQLDAVLNPGNSGGPVLDREGKVVGVVLSGVPGTGINMAIPVSHLERFLARPEIVFTPPVVTLANQSRPVEFRAKAMSLLPTATPLALELILQKGQGTERRFPMQLKEGSYRAEAVPFPRAAGPEVFPVKIKYDDGWVSGMVEDRSFRIGQETFQLSQVHTLRPGPKTVVQLSNGRTLDGSLSDLAVIPVHIGKQSWPLQLARAVEITVEAPDDGAALFCTVVARQASKEVGRRAVPLYLEGQARSSLVVGSNGLHLEGMLTNADPKDRSLQFAPHKVYKVRMNAGQKYTIDLVSRAFDAYLRLEDSTEKELARDDDSGGNLNARIVFTAPATGSYRIIATTFNRQVGPFTLSVRMD